MTTRKWIATTADGREVEIGLHEMLTAIAAVLKGGNGEPIVEIRREGEPSRAQLLAAVAAARKELERVLTLGCDNSGTLVADEAAKAARTALAALPETT